MIDCTSINLQRARFSDKPFQHFICENVLDPELSLSLLGWLETEAPWNLVEADFYEQFEFSFFQAELPSNLSFLASEPFLRAVTSDVEGLFNASLASEIHFTAHKLEPGQRIRVHNDCRRGGETHRLLVQLNRGWTDKNGGALMLFNSGDATDVHSVLWPLHNSSVGFAISQQSNHAVSTIKSGERFTLVFSFYQNASRR
jgi:Rps23 Pro-64 3,4-dihydroxylase Tpa1-like proline 4-hydroxylase